MYLHLQLASIVTFVIICLLPLPLKPLFILTKPTSIGTKVFCNTTVFHFCLSVCAFH